MIHFLGIVTIKREKNIIIFKRKLANIEKNVFTCIINQEHLVKRTWKKTLLITLIMISSLKSQLFTNKIMSIIEHNNNVLSLSICFPVKNYFLK